MVQLEANCFESFEDGSIELQVGYSLWKRSLFSSTVVDAEVTVFQHQLVLFGLIREIAEHLKLLLIGNPVQDSEQVLLVIDEVSRKILYFVFLDEERQPPFDYCQAYVVIFGFFPFDSIVIPVDDVPPVVGLQNDTMLIVGVQ